MVLGRVPKGSLGHGWHDVVGWPQARRVPHVLALRIDGPLFYANCEKLTDVVRPRRGTHRRAARRTPGAAPQ